MSDLTGDILERQRLAFEWPIWRMAQAQDQLFRHQCQLPTGLWLQSILTVDCFVEPHSWHCAVGFLHQPARLDTPNKADALHRQIITLEALPVARWRRDEKALAISIARELLAGVGEAQSVAWMWSQYYEMTFQAWRKLTGEELQNIQQKMAEIGNPKAFVLPDAPGRSPADGSTIIRSH